MRREAEGGRWSGNGIGGELPGRGKKTPSASWGVASGGETCGVASKTQTSCPLEGRRGPSKTLEGRRGPSCF